MTLAMPDAAQCHGNLLVRAALTADMLNLIGQGL